MFNPFLKFEPHFISQFRKLGHRYLISQTFKRDNDLLKNPDTISLMFSNYNDKGLAQIHFNALAGDKYAAIIDLENEKHRVKIENILVNEKYSLYTNIVQDKKIIKDAVDKLFADKIKSFISHKTRWRIGGSKTIVPLLEIIFGELYVVLQYNNETIRVTLEEIEGY